MTDELIEIRLQERRIMFLLHVFSVILLSVLSAGFGGGFDRVFTADNWTLWAFVFSPLVTLGLWLKAKRDFVKAGTRR